MRIQEIGCIAKCGDVQYGSCTCPGSCCAMLDMHRIALTHDGHWQQTHVDNGEREVGAPLSDNLISDCWDILEPMINLRQPIAIVTWASISEAYHGHRLVQNARKPYWMTKQMWAMIVQFFLASACVWLSTVNCPDYRIQACDTLHLPLK